MTDRNSRRVWTAEEIHNLWPQAEGELRGFQGALEDKSGLTAAQLGMALQMAGVEFGRLKSDKELSRKLWYLGEHIHILEIWSKRGDMHPSAVDAVGLARQAFGEVAKIVTPAQ